MTQLYTIGCLLLCCPVLAKHRPLGRKGAVDGVATEAQMPSPDLRWRVTHQHTHSLVQ